MIQRLNNVKNPKSTLTNLAYVVVGVLLLPVNLWVGCLSILLGIASTGFHATRTDCWQKFDVVMIYYVFAVIAGWMWLGNIGLVLGALVGTIAYFSFDKYQDYSTYKIGFFGLMCLIPYVYHIGGERLIDILFFFGVAFFFMWIADHEGDEEGRLYDWAHSIWHIMTAIGIYFLVYHYSTL